MRPVPEHPHLSWDQIVINGRGTVGETVLHLCCLLATSAADPHFTVASFLLERFGEQYCEECVHPDECEATGSCDPDCDCSVRNVLFPNVMYTGGLYRGETSMHLACAKNNYELVKLLIQHKADVASPFACVYSFACSSLAHIRWC